MYHIYLLLDGYFAMDFGDFNSCKTKLGERIRYLRTHKSYKVREFALLADIEHHQLINIEAGRVDLRFSTIFKIASALEIEVCELLVFNT